MEFPSYVERNSVCDPLPMSNSSGMDSASSFLGFPLNSGTMNASTLENWIQFHNSNMRRSKGETQTGDDGDAGLSMSSAVCQKEGHGSLSSTVHSEAKSVTTTMALPPPFVTSTSSAYLSVKGATGKLSKKRSRASRRAPTTLLSTDASNFRAMVQQFTGIPEPPLGSWSTEQRSQGPLLGRSFSHMSVLPFASFPSYRSYRPQQYPPFPFQAALREDVNSSVVVSSQGHTIARAGLVDDLGLNSSYSPMVSRSMTLPSEGRARYPI